MNFPLSFLSFNTNFSFKRIENPSHTFQLPKDCQISYVQKVFVETASTSSDNLFKESLVMLQIVDAQLKEIHKEKDNEIDEFYYSIFLTGAEVISSGREIQTEGYK
jgi:phosphate uptake regulator